MGNCPDRPLVEKARIIDVFKYEDMRRNSFLIMMIIEKERTRVKKNG